MKIVKINTNDRDKIIYVAKEFSCEDHMMFLAQREVMRKVDGTDNEEYDPYLKRAHTTQLVHVFPPETTTPFISSPDSYTIASLLDYSSLSDLYMEQTSPSDLNLVYISGETNYTSVPSPTVSADVALTFSGSVQDAFASANIQQGGSYGS